MDESGYWNRSVRLLTQDAAWWVRTLALIAWSIVPFLGAVVLLGYRMVLMRDIAWGLERGLPRYADRNEILRLGIRGYLVGLVWAIPALVPFFIVLAAQTAITVGRVLRGGHAQPPVTWPMMAALYVSVAIVGVFTNIAVLRVAIYSRAAAGFSIVGIGELIRSHRKGFLRVSLLFVLTLGLGIALGLGAGRIARNLTDSPFVVFSLALALGWVCRLATVPLSLVVAYAYGLWARETKPASWPPLGMTWAAWNESQSRLAVMPQAANEVVASAP